jgi:hypothetical protein
VGLNTAEQARQRLNVAHEARAIGTGVPGRWPNNRGDENTSEPANSHAVSTPTQPAERAAIFLEKVLCCRTAKRH